ncbi:ComF family protein [Tropicimonas sp. IMCC34043]|uniref:ComF family protein n=1 Tax=Tropicimonas sp. IMCC34043 TaxID=2248760 RepID=UPI000E247551|nr:ComF family protein [Tropicimonas sp. IMCC34043]
MIGLSGVRAGAQAVIAAIYPPHCVNCNAIVGHEGALCGPCWRDTPFITGLVCDLCGTPLPGEAPKGPVHCDDCLKIARPWTRGRAAMTYGGNGRRLVLGLKHGDRTDLARAAAGWMATAGAALLQDDPLIVPVPLHWRRLFQRRYNQSALLARALAARTGLACCPDLLQRRRFTGSQDGKGIEARFANLASAIRVAPGRAALSRCRVIVLVDDVMTSGATFAACAEACLAAGTAEVRVLALARVSKDG